MSITFHTLHDLPGPLKEFWQRVGRAQDAAGYFTSSPEWVALMAGDDAARPSVVAVHDADRCRAIMPFLPRPWQMDFRLLGKKLAQHALRTWKVGGGDLVEDTVSTELLAESVRATLGQHPDVDALWFEHVGAPERLARLEAAARASGVAFPIRLFSALPHYRLAMPPTLEAATALRSSKSLQRLRSKEKSLAREAGHPCRVVEIRTPEDWGPYAERIEALVNESWQAQLLGHGFRLDSVRGTAERGWLRGFLLVAGETPLAFTLYYAGMETMVSAVLAYDRRYARFSPGAILFQHTLTRIYAAAPPRFLDFGEGDADYKQQWANDVIQVSAVLLVRRTAKLRALAACYRGVRGTDRAVRAALRCAKLDRLLVRRAKMAAAEGDAASADSNQ